MISPDNRQPNNAGNDERHQGRNQKHPGVPLALPSLPARKQNFSQQVCDHGHDYLNDSETANGGWRTSDLPGMNRG